MRTAESSRRSACSSGVGLEADGAASRRSCMARRRTALRKWFRAWFTVIETRNRLANRRRDPLYAGLHRRRDPLTRLRDQRVERRERCRVGIVTCDRCRLGAAMPVRAYGEVTDRVDRGGEHDADRRREGAERPRGGDARGRCAGGENRARRDLDAEASRRRVVLQDHRRHAVGVSPRSRAPVSGMAPPASVARTRFRYSCDLSISVCSDVTVSVIASSACALNVSIVPAR